MPKTVTGISLSSVKRERDAKVRAWQIGNRARVAQDGRTGVIDEVEIIDGVLKYHVTSDTDNSWGGWFTGWEIEHA